MSATDLYQAGNLAAAVDAQLQAVKAAPADEGKRVFLFELLAFAGDLDRAGRQLQAVPVQDPQKQAVQSTYALLLDAERKRRAVFAGTATPQFFNPPPAHVLQRLEAIANVSANQTAAAADALRRAEEGTPALRGDLNGNPFELLRDADDRFGPVLEVLAHGEYFWLPLEQLDSLVTNPPRYPRDLIWLPARITLQGGPAGEVFLPALYPGSHDHADDAVRLGRATDWLPIDGGPVRGVGAKLFLAGDDPIGLLEWRNLSVTPTAGSTAPA